MVHGVNNPWVELDLHLISYTLSTLGCQPEKEKIIDNVVDHIKQDGVAQMYV